MATPIIMPKQGQSVESCIITKWFKTKGDMVSTGDILFSYETDKAAFDLESPADGMLLEVFFQDGAEVPVLENVAVIGKKGEPTGSFQPGAVISTVKTEPSAPVSKEITVNENAAKNIIKSSSGDNKIRISPRAKRLAGEKGIRYDEVQGSGPNGRII